LREFFGTGADVGPDTLVYDGSLQEWAPDETLPMETGLSGPV
jgi:3-mercaptopyruvate sulfurtransferase SseA